MCDKNENNSLLAFLLGGAIGVILGILFAPQKGKETRESLGKIIDKVKEKGAKAEKELSELYNEGKEFFIKEEDTEEK